MYNINNNNNNLLVIIIIKLKIKLNPWRYSSEEARPIERVAAKWQYRGPCGYQSIIPKP